MQTPSKPTGNRLCSFRNGGAPRQPALKDSKCLQLAGNRAGSEASALEPLWDMTTALTIPLHLSLKGKLPERQRRVKDICWLAEVLNAKQPLWLTTNKAIGVYFASKKSKLCWDISPRQYCS